MSTPPSSSLLTVLDLVPFGQTGGESRYFALRTNFNHDKIILEYREPAPRGLETMESIPFGMTDQIREFEDRARKAFTLGLPDPKLGPIQDGFPQGVRWQFMSDPYLGDVLFQEPLDRF